ncbi:MAG: alpha-galactosidase [Clostridia bacterium]|nr:alpha-galactosidase [Clostridia bacterium]
MLDFSQNGISLKIDILDNGGVILKDFSASYTEDNRKTDPRFCNIAEIHINGKNPDDHHFAKHTGGSETYTLKYSSHRYYENSLGNKLEFVLSNDSIEATVHYQLYSGISTVRAWTEVKNISSLPVGLEYVASFSYTGFDTGSKNVQDKIRVLIPHNTWCREADWREYTLSQLGYEKTTEFSGKRISVHNTGSFSCKEFLPMGAVMNMESKNMYLWQIENNGSWQWEISDIDNMLYMKLSGPTEQENGWYKELMPGEVFESVKVAIALGTDFNSALEALTQYRRKIVRKKTTDYTLPVIFNDYMNCLMGDPTEDKVLPIIDIASELGAEYFCIDAGWYADGTWWDSVGEWMPSTWRFPRGLQYLLNRIREKGMIPGLWLEIEVMGINCPLVKNLPDSFFFMRHGKRVIDHGRYQLDFRNPEVRKFATGVIDRLVTEYGVGYIKNDYNIEIGCGTEQNADSFGDGLLSHNRAYLSWLDEIHEKYPSLVWENCSSGGMRMEYASLTHADIQSVSDQTDYRHNAKVASACATAVLPEQGAIWSYPKTGDTKNAFVMNMVNSMLKRIHLSGQVYGWTPEETELVKDAIRVYKNIRSVIPKSIPFYPLGIPQYDGEFLCEAYKFEGSVHMAVWRMETDCDTVTIPLNKKIRDAKILYPLNNNSEIKITENTVTVKLYEKLTASVFKLYTEE